MQRIESILAATDLSANAEWCARRAARLASEHGAALRLLHVREGDAPLLSAFGTADESLGRKLESSARKRLDALAESLRQAFAVEPEVRTIAGESVREVVAAAESTTDLLVLGAQGEHPWREMLLGSTAERVVRKARTPVLVVKRSPHEPYRRALIAVDIAQPTAQVASAALAVARFADLVLLHVADFPFEGKLKLAGVPQAKIDDYRRRTIGAAQERLNGLAAALPQAHASALCLVSTGDPARSVVEQAIRMDADLVVLTKRQSLLEDIILGSVSRRVLSDVECDVLIDTAAQAGSAA